jgi:hypothetical protein
LSIFAGKFGANDPLVKQVLAGKSPHARAVELVSGTKLKDVAVRRELYTKNAAPLQTARDPTLDLARMIDAPAREAHEAREEIKKQAYAEIAKARFAIESTSTYSDATFTLRLSYGTVRDYEQDANKFPRSPILLAYISALPSTTTNRRSTCRSVGSTRSRI